MKMCSLHPHIPLASAVMSHYWRPPPYTARLTLPRTDAYPMLQLEMVTGKTGGENLRHHLEG